MYNKKITSYDNKEIIIGGCHLMLCSICFQANRKMSNSNMRFLRLNSQTLCNKTLPVVNHFGDFYFVEFLLRCITDILTNKLSVVL